MKDAVRIVCSLSKRYAGHCNIETLEQFGCRLCGIVDKEIIDFVSQNIAHCHRRTAGRPENRIDRDLALCNIELVSPSVPELTDDGLPPPFPPPSPESPTSRVSAKR